MHLLQPKRGIFALEMYNTERRYDLSCHTERAANARSFGHSPLWWLFLLPPALGMYQQAGTGITRQIGACWYLEAIAVAHHRTKHKKYVMNVVCKFDMYDVFPIKRAYARMWH